MQKFYVYMHINKENKKAYIGITSRVNPEYRWRNGEGYITQTKFYRAITKYGWDNFDHTIVAADLTKAEAVCLEKQLIKQYNTIDNGYNTDEGGNTSTQQKKTIYWLDDTKNIKAVFSCAEEVEQKLGLNHSAVTACCNKPQRNLTLHGHIFCYAENYDTFEIRSKKPHPKCKKVCQIDSEGELLTVYDSIQQAAKINNLSASHITACCKGTRNSIGGYFWSYADQFASLKIKVSSAFKYHTNNLIIYQYTLTNELVKTFRSCREAAKAVNCAASSIARCCRGERKTAAGFKWSYTKLDEE